MISRNIATAAHVDHGKTTLVDRFTSGLERSVPTNRLLNAQWTLKWILNVRTRHYNIIGEKYCCGLTIKIHRSIFWTPLTRRLWGRSRTDYENG